MYKVTSGTALRLAARYRVIDRVGDRVANSMLGKCGGLFDRHTQDLALDVPVGGLESEVVRDHLYVPGDLVLFPEASGWALVRILEVL